MLSGQLKTESGRGTSTKLEKGEIGSHTKENEIESEIDIDRRKLEKESYHLQHFFESNVQLCLGCSAVNFQHQGFSSLSEFRRKSLACNGKQTKQLINN